MKCVNHATETGTYVMDLPGLAATLQGDE